MAKRTGGADATAGALVLLVVLAVVLSLISPMVLVILLIWFELAALARVLPAVEQPFGLSKDERLVIADSIKTHRSAVARLEVAHSRGHQLRLRQDGGYDERNPLSKILNEEIDEGGHDQRNARFEVMDLAERPFNRWNAWADEFRTQWGVRIAAALCAPGTIWLLSVWSVRDLFALKVSEEVTAFHVLAPGVGAVIGYFVGRSIGESVAKDVVPAPPVPDVDTVIAHGLAAFPGLFLVERPRIKSANEEIGSPVFQPIPETAVERQRQGWTLVRRSRRTALSVLVWATVLTVAASSVFLMLMPFRKRASTEGMRTSAIGVEPRRSSIVVEPIEPKAPPHRRAVEANAPPIESVDCLIRIGSTPWVQVLVDGTPVGFTPLVDFPVRCGTHDLILRNPKANIEQTEQFEVRTGAPFKKIFTFKIADE